MCDEFALKDANAAVDTMTSGAHVNLVPVLTGGVGSEQVREFYAAHFIPKMPADIEIVPISRTIGSESLVDEMIIRFTHTIELDWMLPGIAPTGKRVECATVGIIQFRNGKLFSEHLCWDQASVLVQLGLLDSSKLPVAGVETARKVADPKLPSNRLMERLGDMRAYFSTAHCGVASESGTHNPGHAHRTGRQAKAWSAAFTLVLLLAAQLVVF